MAQELIGRWAADGLTADPGVRCARLRPGRQTAAYLSDVTAGTPMRSPSAQGSAAAFSGLRIAREYAASAGVRRALLIVVEQAALPYDCPIPLPSRHQGVAMLYSDGDGDGPMLARASGVRQHPGVPAGEVAGVAAAVLSELAAGHREVALVLSDALAAVWTAPAAGGYGWPSRPAGHRGLVGAHR